MPVLLRFYLRVHTKGGVGVGGVGRITFSEKNIDDMEKIILSCTHSKAEDGAVSIILIEEMPAYFLGQKDLDSVIKTAQSRAQKVLDERK